MCRYRSRITAKLGVYIIIGSPRIEIESICPGPEIITAFNRVHEHKQVLSSPPRRPIDIVLSRTRNLSASIQSHVIASLYVYRVSHEDSLTCIDISCSNGILVILI